MTTLSLLEMVSVESWGLYGITFRIGVPVAKRGKHTLSNRVCILNVVNCQNLDAAPY